MGARRKERESEENLEEWKWGGGGGGLQINGKKAEAREERKKFLAEQRNYLIRDK